MARAKKTPQVSLKKAKVAKAVTTRVKADVSDAFAEICVETAGQEPLDPKVAGLLKANREEVEKTAAGMSVEKVVQDLSSLGLNISRSLAMVEEQLILSIGDLKAVNEAAEAKREELQKLHDIDVAAMAVANLVDDYNAKMRNFEIQMANVRDAWAKEQAEHSRLVAERNAEVEKIRKREENDYEYKINRERQIASDKFEEDLRKRAKDAKAKEEQLVAQWNEREKNLAAREQELNDYRQQVAEFPKKLADDVAKAQESVRKAVSQEYNHKIALIEANSKATVDLLNSKITSLNEALDSKNLLIEDLQNQLTAAGTKVQEIAAKALDSASGRQALEVATTLSSFQKEQSTSSRR